MKILYAAKLEKSFQNQKIGDKAWGQNAKSIRLRHQQLEAASCLEDLRNAPGRWHELTGDRKGAIAASVTANQRLIIEPSDAPPALLPQGGIDWKNVRTVTITAIEDYHGN